MKLLKTVRYTALGEKQKALQRKLKIHPVGCLKSFREKKKNQL